METYIYTFKHLPNLLITDEKRLNTWKQGILLDIKYEGGFEVKESHFKLEGNTMILSVVLPSDKENMITCALHNLHGAGQIYRGPIESC